MSENNIILESCLKLEPELETEPKPKPETTSETEPRNVYDDEISRLKKLISLNPVVPLNPYKKYYIITEFENIFHFLCWISK